MGDEGGYVPKTITPAASPVEAAPLFAGDSPQTAPPVDASGPLKAPAVEGLKPLDMWEKEQGTRYISDLFPDVDKVIHREQMDAIDSFIKDRIKSEGYSPTIGVYQALMNRMLEMVDTTEGEYSPDVVGRVYDMVIPALNLFGRVHGQNNQR